MESGKTFAGILNPPWDKKAEEGGYEAHGGLPGGLPDYPGRGLRRHHPVGGRPSRGARGLPQVPRGGRRIGATIPPTARAALQLLREAQGIDDERAVKELASLPATTELNLPGLQVPLDLRISFDMAPGKGTDLTAYYDLQYHFEAT